MCNQIRFCVGKNLCTKPSPGTVICCRSWRHMRRICSHNGTLRRDCGAWWRASSLARFPGAEYQAAAIAQHLSLSERSFRRRLAEEGTTFSDILDRVGNSLALRYLEDRRISLQQIAWLLGYSELSAFNHAFKRWSGTSPRSARQRSALSAPA